MANNFRIGLSGTGGCYVSKATISGSANGSADLPFPDIINIFYNAPNADTGAQSVVGAGTYFWPNRGARVVNSEYVRPWSVLVADGFVKIIGLAYEITTISATKSYLTSFYFQQAIGYDFGYSQCTYNSCIFKVNVANASSSNSTGSGGIGFSDCIFYNVNIGAGGGHNYTRCLFFNCTIACSNITFSYIDRNSAISAGTATNNNVDPGCDTAANKGLNINGAGWTTVSAGAVSQDPQFNALAKEDFTLRQGSPHLRLGIGPARYRFANSYFFVFTGGDGDAVTTQNCYLKSAATGAIVPLVSVTGSPNALNVNAQGGITIVPSNSGDGTATIITDRIPFSDITQRMVFMNMIAGLNMDSAYPAGGTFNLGMPEPFNNNVPDYSNGAVGSAGRNPNRLSYGMRWSTLNNPLVINDVDWYLGAEIPEFEWLSQPLWNSGTPNIGNGSAAFNGSTGVQFVDCNWYQLYIRMRNNYAR